MMQCRDLTCVRSCRCVGPVGPKQRRHNSIHPGRDNLKCSFKAAKNSEKIRIRGTANGQLAFHYFSHILLFTGLTCGCYRHTRCPSFDINRKEILRHISSFSSDIVHMPNHLEISCEILDKDTSTIAACDLLTCLATLLLCLLLGLSWATVFVCDIKSMSVGSFISFILIYGETKSMIPKPSKGDRW